MVRSQKRKELQKVTQNEDKERIDRNLVRNIADQDILEILKMNKEGSKKDVLENPEAVVLLGVLGSEDKRAKVITVGIGNRKNVVF